MFRCDFCAKIFDSERQCIVHERTEHEDRLRANDNTLKRPLEALTRIVEDAWRSVDADEVTEMQMVLRRLQEKCEQSLGSADGGILGANSRTDRPLIVESNKLPALNGHDVARNHKTTLPQSNIIRESATPIEETPTMVQRERPTSAMPSSYFDRTLQRLESSVYMSRRHVPGRKSKIWDFFTPQDEEWCTCNTCEKTFKISTTANLQKHLISRHPVEAEQCAQKLAAAKQLRHFRPYAIPTANRSATLTEMKTGTVQNDRNASIDAQLNFTRGENHFDSVVISTPERSNDEMSADTTHENIS